LGFFRVEPLQHVRIVADHLLFARYVGVELLDPAGEFHAAALDARRLFLDLRLGDGQPLISGGSGGFGLAQFGQSVGADGLLLRGFHLSACAFADDGCRRGKRGLRFRLLRLGQGPAHMQQRRFGLADIGGKVLETRSLAGLTL
jgi:hypothetical protein